MDKKILSSSDVWFSAFLMHKGVPLHSFDTIMRGKVRCNFELTQDEWQSFKVEFNNSELVKFKHIIDAIKDLGF